MATWYRTGTVDVTNNSVNVAGTNTSWQAQIAQGDLFTLDGSVFYEVATVSSDTALVLQSAWQGSTLTGQAYAIIRNFTSTTNAVLAAKLADLMNRWQIREDEMLEWLSTAGTVTITDALGTTHAVKTPMAIQNEWIGRSDITVNTADVTLNAAQAANYFLNLTGTLTGNRAVILPTAQSHIYTVKNGTTGAFTVTVKTAAGTGVTIPQGSQALLHCDGTNIVSVMTYLDLTASVIITPSVSVTGTTPAANGIFLPGTNILGISTNSAERARVLADGTVLINATTATASGSKLQIGGPLEAFASAAGSATYPIFRSALHSDNGGAPGVWGYRSRGSVSAPTAVAASDILLMIDAYGYRSGAYSGMGRMQFIAGGADDSELRISTMNAGTLTEGLRLTSTQKLLIGTTTDDGINRLQVSGSVKVSAGTNAVPAITFGDADTGVYAPAAGQIGFTANGKLAAFAKNPSGVPMLTIAGEAVLSFESVVTGTNYLCSANAATLSSTSTTQFNPFVLACGISPQGASLTTVYGVLSNFNLKTSAAPITTFYNHFARVDSAADYTGDLTTYSAYYASPPVWSGSGKITNYYGFQVADVLAAALVASPVVRGVFSTISNGIGRSNIYANGTAINYFAGRVGIGASNNYQSDILLYIGGATLAQYPDIGGSYNANTKYAAQVNPTIDSTTTSRYGAYTTAISTQAASFTLTTLEHFSAWQGTIGAGSAVTTQMGFRAMSTLVGATNNYGFRGEIPAAAGNWNLYLDGAAKSYIAGNLLIGASTDNGYKLDVTGSAQFQGAALILKHANPNFYWIETDAAADNQRMTARLSAGAFVLQALTDADVGGGDYFRISRSGNLMTLLEFGGTTPVLAADETNDEVRVKGQFILHPTAPVDDGSGSTAQIGCSSASTTQAGLKIYSTNASNPMPWLALLGKRSDGNGYGNFAGQIAMAKLNTVAATGTGSILGRIMFGGNHTDGTEANILYAAQIAGISEGAFTSSAAMPTGIAFYTGNGTGRTPADSNVNAGTERMRITYDGRVSIGDTGAAGQSLRVVKAMTGAASAYQIVAGGAIQSDVTTAAYIIGTSVATQAASFVIPVLLHFNASLTSIGSGSSITEQYGFNASSALVGASLNIGFRGNLPSGAGNWNAYMSGTAPNYFAGSVLIGSNTDNGYKLEVTGTAMVTSNLRTDGTFAVGTGPTTYAGIFLAKAISGNTTAWGVRSDTTFQSDVTSIACGFSAQGASQNTAFTLASYQGLRVDTFNKGAASTVTNVIGMICADQTAGTNNYGVRSELTSGANKWNFYAGGTALNYMNGGLLIGSTTDAGYKLDVTGTARITSDVTLSGRVGVSTGPLGYGGIIVGGNLTGSTNAWGVRSACTFQSDVTSIASGVSIACGTQATTYTLSSYQALRIDELVKGSGSTVTNSFGIVIGNLSAGTSNFGINIDISAGANKWALYASQGAKSYHNGNFLIGASTDNGYKLEVTGTAKISGGLTLTTPLAITEGGTGRTDGGVGGFKNKLINPNFDFWQHGTSFLGLTGTVTKHAADRWRYDALGHTANYTQQSFTLGQTDVPGEPKYWARIAITAAGSGTGDYAYFVQNIEGVRTFAGKTVTLSFYAKADANKTVAVALTQFFGDGGSPSAAVHMIGTPLSLTSSWQKFTRTFSVPSIAGKTLGTTEGTDKFRVRFWLSAGSDHSAATNSFNTLQTITFDVARVQIEDGSVATAFEERPQQAEFALCQRYYQVHSAVLCSGYNNSSGVIYSDLGLPCTMRVAPTATIVNPTYNNANTMSINMANTTHIRLGAIITSVGGGWAIAGSLTLDAEL